MERCFAASRISRNGLPSICVSRAPCSMVRSPALTRSVTPYFEICCFAAVHVFIAFDLLFLNGRGLRPLPLIEPLCGGGCQIVTTSPQPTLITGRARNTFECMRPPPNTLLSRCLSPQVDVQMAGTQSMHRLCCLQAGWRFPRDHNEGVGQSEPRCMPFEDFR